MGTRLLMNLCINEVKKSRTIGRALSTSCPALASRVPDVRDTSLLTKDMVKKQRRDRLITIEDTEDLSIVSGVPEEHVKTRMVRIYQPAKNSMQSGTNNINHWQIDFDTRERWENHLIGWCSSGDPLSNLKVEFTSPDEAIKHCERMKWKWYIQKPNEDNPKPRTYGANFAWNKRTRVSTK